MGIAYSGGSTGRCRGLVFRRRAEDDGEASQRLRPSPADSPCSVSATRVLLVPRDQEVAHGSSRRTAQRVRRRARDEVARGRGRALRVPRSRAPWSQADGRIEQPPRAVGRAQVPGADLAGLGLGSEGTSALPAVTAAPLAGRGLRRDLASGRLGPRRCLRWISRVAVLALPDPLFESRRRGPLRLAAKGCLGPDGVPRARRRPAAARGEARLGAGGFQKKLASRAEEPGL